VLIHLRRQRRPIAFRLDRCVLVLGFLATLLCFCLRPAAAQLDPTQEIIRERIEHLRQFKTLVIGDAAVASTIVVPDFYERREFQLAWVRRSAIEDLLRAIRESEVDGLDPRDYHLIALERLRHGLEASASPTPAMLADLDILLTDALVRLGYHLMFGKVDPERLDPSWNMSREISGFEPVAIIQRALEADSLYQAINQEKPQHPFYTNLKAALARYRALKATGGWAQIAAGPTLKLGMHDERVPRLRQRLSITGDLAPASSDSSQLFDRALEKAVKLFQRRHGLAADGILGPGTLAALNVSVDERLEQLRVNLERGRWVLHNLESTFLVVNVAGYHAYYVQDGQMVWQGRAQVGKPYRQTPIFKSEMTYLVFNPTWTVPPTILAEDYLPALRRDPSYLQRKGLKVIDRAAGRVIDPGQVNWSRHSVRQSPYLLRQDPGPQNALGRVKFIFPNDHAVFLHDTPSQALFNQTNRAFSSGCIRVENAIELARLLLNDEMVWNRQAIDRVVELGKTRTLFLERPIPVLLLYWTAWVDADARINFRHDLYGRDKLVQQGLASGFRFRKRPVISPPPVSSPAGSSESGEQDEDQAY
jgi:L,D-transpeptidase YcbB